MKRFFLGIIMVAIVSLMFTGCQREASVAAYNVSAAADQFEIYRRVVFYNGITDKYILEIRGYCSIETSRGELVVMVKTGPSTYLKHFLGLSDNVTYFAEQIDPAKVSGGQYRVIFKPSEIIPDIDMK
jgi:hypothetical protein